MGKHARRQDVAIINIGVATAAETAKEALAANTERMQAVLATIKAAGVADKDVQTTDFAINPAH